MNDLVFHLLTIAIFLVVGIWCLTQARRMQNRAIEAGNNLNLKLFRGYIRSRTYVVVTRIIGAASIVIALLLTFLILRR